GLLASAASLRVNYNANSVAFLGVADGDLGPATASGEEGAAPANFRDVATLGDTTNSSDVVTAFTLSFQVLNGAETPFSITLEDDPDAGLVLADTGVATDFPHTYDNTASENLVVGS